MALQGRIAPANPGFAAQSGESAGAKIDHEAPRDRGFVAV
jgi:hypothetical protein